MTVSKIVSDEEIASVFHDLLVKPSAHDATAGLHSANLNALAAPTFMPMKHGHCGPANFPFFGKTHLTFCCESLAISMIEFRRLRWYTYLARRCFRFHRVIDQQSLTSP